MWEYDVPYLGYKYNRNSIMAQIARVSLKYLKAIMTTEEKSPRFMRANCQKIKYIYDPTFKWSSRHLFSILVKNRSKIIKKLKLKRSIRGTLQINS